MRAIPRSTVVYEGNRNGGRFGSTEMARCVLSTPLPLSTRGGARIGVVAAVVRVFVRDRAGTGCLPEVGERVERAMRELRRTTGGDWGGSEDATGMS